MGLRATPPLLFPCPASREVMKRRRGRPEQSDRRQLFEQRIPPGVGPEASAPCVEVRRCVEFVRLVTLRGYAGWQPTRRQRLEHDAGVALDDEETFGRFGEQQ